MSLNKKLAAGSIIVVAALATIFIAFMMISNDLNRQLDDPFFQTPMDEWVSQADDLPVERVYELYKELAENHQPLILAESLGKRGRVSIVLWLNDLEATHALRRQHQFSPLIREAYVQSQYNLCEDESLLRRAIRLVTVANNRNDTRPTERDIRYACGIAYPGQYPEYFDRLDAGKF